MSLKIFPTVIIHLLADYLGDAQDKAILYYYVYTNYSTITKIGRTLLKLLKNRDDQYWVVIISIINRDLFKNLPIGVLPPLSSKNVMARPLTIKHIQSGRIDNYSFSKDYEDSLEYENRDNTTVIINKKKTKISHRRKHAQRGKKSILLKNRLTKLDCISNEFDEDFNYHNCLEDGCCGYYETYPSD